LVVVIGVVIDPVACFGSQAFDLRRYFSAALLGQLHYQREVFPRPTSGSLVVFLAEGHILGSESPHFDEQLSGGAALRAAVEQAAVSPAASLRHSRWRPQIDLSPVFLPSLFELTSFLSAPKSVSFVCHLPLHNG
jgi:hypothetical protein